MNLKLIVGVVVICSGAPKAFAYEWLNKHHACIVETSQFVRFGDERIGDWTNAPKSLFVDFRTCKDYAADNDLPYEMSDILRNKSYERAMINECVAASPDGRMNTVMIDDLSVGFPPFSSIFFPLLPIASGGGTVKFQEDGYFDFVQHGELKDETDAWFMLRAHCTVLKR